MTKQLLPQQRLFLAADAALREVIDQLTPAQLELAAPADWTGDHVATVRGIVEAHARDETWLPDVLAGKTIEEVGDTWAGDLLGDDPIGNYDRINDRAREVVSAPIDGEQLVHLSYGDYPAREYLEHVSYYRGFQAWSIAKLAGIPFHMSDELVDALWNTVEPQLDLLRLYQVFGPAVEVPAGSDRQTQLLGMTGFWTP